MVERTGAIGRRDFFSFLWGDMKYLAAQALSMAMPFKQLVRPPGAQEEVLFLTSCQRCGKCASACPQKAIKLAGPAEGTAAVGTPYLNPAEQPCTFCYQCSDLCPSGALQAPKAGDGCVIGKAKINKELCLAYRQQPCGSCLYACPVENDAIKLVNYTFPEIALDKCTGCGLCANICVAPVPAITIEPV